MKTTTIYACYLPGSLKPDYIGSRQADPTPDGQYCKYVGAGAWVTRSGSLRILRSCQARPWGALLEKMTPQERLAIRVDTLDIVDDADRWSAEARAIRLHQPPFNAAPTHAKPMTPRTSHNTSTKPATVRKSRTTGCTQEKERGKRGVVSPPPPCSVPARPRE